MKIFFQLTRVGLSMAIAFSALIGCLLYTHFLNSLAVFTYLGVLLLSGGASAFNQYIERHLDARMGRTIDRPLPSGHMNVKTALLIASSLSVAGFLLLLFTSNILAAFLGAFNLIWYILVYTPLKTRSPMALLSGALTGAVPPVIGWVAGGGEYWNLIIVAVAFFMFLWQIPHFWLILFKYGKEYEAAGFSPITRIVSSGNLHSILFIWIICTAIASLFFPLFHIINHFHFIIILILLNVYLIYLFYRFLFKANTQITLRAAFGSVYLYQILTLCLLVADSFHW